MDSDPVTLGLYSQSELVKNRSISATELALAHIERIEARDSVIKAFSWFSAEDVLQHAADIDAKKLPGVIDGVPIGVKDIIDVEGWPSTWGSSVYSGRKPHWDASCVALSREAGANIFGKTVTTEFAYFYPGKTVNPHNPAHTPGGSSMGSAAAVADHMLPFAFGTQTAASVIRPAAYCGVIGYKASHGSFDLQGICGLSPSLDTLGFICRDLRDIPLMRSVLCGDRRLYTERDDSDPPRVGFVRTPYWENADADTRQLLEDTVEKLARNGAAVDEIAFPDRFNDLNVHQGRVMAFEAARSRAYEFLNHHTLLSEQFVALIDEGRGITFNACQDSKRVADQAQQWLSTRFDEVDLLLTPSAPGEAPAGLEATGDPMFSRLWTLLKVPSITIPAGLGRQGLPLGVQLVGRYGGDISLVRDTDWVQRTLATALT